MKEHPRSWMFLMRSMIIYKNRNLFQLFNEIALDIDEDIYQSRNLFQLFNWIDDGKGVESTIVEIYFSYSTHVVTYDANDLQ